MVMSQHFSHVCMHFYRYQVSEGMELMVTLDYHRHTRMPLSGVKVAPCNSSVLCDLISLDKFLYNIDKIIGDNE